MNRKEAAFKLVRAIMSSPTAAMPSGLRAAREAQAAIEELERNNLAPWVIEQTAVSGDVQKLIPWISSKEFSRGLVSQKVGFGKYKQSTETWGDVLKGDSDWLLYLVSKTAEELGGDVDEWHKSATVNSRKCLWVLHYGEAVMNGQEIKEPTKYEFLVPKRKAAPDEVPF